MSHNMQREETPQRNADGLYIKQDMRGRRFKVMLNCGHATRDVEPSSSERWQLKHLDYIIVHRYPQPPDSQNLVAVKDIIQFPETRTQNPKVREKQLKE